MTLMTKGRSWAQVAMEWSPIVRIYESRFWRRNPVFQLINHLSFEQEEQLIIQAAELKGNETVLDLACGTGSYSRLFANTLLQGNVIGLDLSRPMLEQALKKAQTLQIKNVKFIQGSALKLPLPDHSVDVVNCCGALHLFPDTQIALNEIYRVLKPAGRFTTAVFRHPSGRIGQKIESFANRKVGVKTFTSTELQDQLKKVGFSESRVWHNKGGWLILGGKIKM